MFELRKWEPLKELSTIQRDMDDLFRRTFGSLTSGLFGREFRGEWIPSMDSYMKEGKLVVRVDLPGIDPKDIEVFVTGNVLTVKGERKADVEEKKAGFIFHETSYGSFERTVTLPEGCDINKVHASYRNGVLELTMPAKAEALGKRVKVEVEEAKETKKAA